MGNLMLMPAAAAVCGVIGGVLRGVNLLTGYEPETSLPIPGNWAQLALVVLTVLTAVLLALSSRRLRGARGAVFEEVFGSDSIGFKTASVLIGFVMIAAGAGGLVQSVIGAVSMPGGIRAIVPLIPLWLLAVVTGGCFIGLAIALARRTVTENTAAMTIVPMFWSCFDLIITFKDNGASPFVGLYVFELAAAVALTYAFYALAGFLYSESNPRRFAVSAGLAAFFCLTTVIGSVIAHFAGGMTFGGETMLRYVCFLAAAVWLLMLLFVQSASLSRKEK